MSLLDDDDENDTREVVLWFIKDTDKARLFSTLPKGNPNAHEVWIPRSVTLHVSKDPAVPNEYQRCVVEVEEWFLEKNNL